MSETVNVVIPAAGAGHRMKSYGPKGSILLGKNRESLIARQLRLLRKRFVIKQVVVVAGFKPTKMVRVLPDDVDVVFNEDHATTNVAKSIALGLSAVRSHDPTLIVYGDLVFSSRLVKELDISMPSLLVEDGGQMRYDEVGANVVQGQVVSLAYGVSIKWAQVAVLHEKEKSLFINEASKDLHRKYYGYEVFNLTIEAGAEYAATFLNTGQLVEIDTSRDIKQANKIVSG